MKSLRKTAVSAGVVLLTLMLAFVPLRARTPQHTSTPRPQAQNPTPAQQPQQQQPPGLRVQVNQVIVPVTVKDGAGRLVPDLRKDEFRILEDNVEQRIIAFSADAFPLSLVLLIDNDLNRKNARQVAESLDSIIAGLSASDEYAMYEELSFARREAQAALPRRFERQRRSFCLPLRHLRS